MKRFKYIYIEIINVCNLNCSFCPKTNRPANIMTAIEFANILDKVISYSEYIYLHVVGEPLLNPELDKILSYCDEKNAKVKLTTNGTLLEKNIGLILSHASVKVVNISLSCIKDLDNIPAQNYLNDTLLAAQCLSKNKITAVLRVWTDIKYISDIKKKIFDNFNFEISLTHNGPQRIHAYLMFDIETDFIWPIMSTADPTPRNSCLGLRKQLAILSDGTVVPCCLDSEGRLNLGNIFADTLEEILSSERAVKIAQGFRNSLAIESFCTTCTFPKNN